MAKKDETETPLSIVAAFDDIVRNSAVLTAGSEDEFLKFVVNSEVSRQRWEHAELECQRLSIELTKCSQDIYGLEKKLQHARQMFDTEQHIRKKAEAERDRMANQLNVLRQLVMETGHELDEDTLLKIRSDTNILSPGLTREAMGCGGRRSVNNLTEDSIFDVEDLSFDDTLGLCESRTRAGTTFNKNEGGRDGRKKRSRSGNRRSGILVVGENARKKERRSGSVGINDIIDVVKIEPREKVRRSKENLDKSGKKRNRSDIRRSGIPVLWESARKKEKRSSVHIELVEISPRERVRRSKEKENIDRSGKKRNRSDIRRSGMVEESARKKEKRGSVHIELVEISPRERVRRSKEENIDLGQVEGGDHSLVERTVLKPEKCVACSKRIKFGKISLKCLHCKVSIHVECEEQVGTCEISSSHPLPFLYTTPSKRENKSVFSSPMLR